MINITHNVNVIAYCLKKKFLTLKYKYILLVGESIKKIAI